MFFIEINFTLRHGCSPVNLLHIFRTLFSKNTSGGLHLPLKLTSKNVNFLILAIVDVNSLLPGVHYGHAYLKVIG